MKLRVIGLISLLLNTPTSLSHAGSAADPDADYDRLDGQGRSGKTVNVVEWEGNLEIHVYPERSLVGLAAKLDQNARGTKVMVLSYRMDSDPKLPLIRRAVLGIPFQPGFQAWKDTSAEGYDKIILSNRALKGPSLQRFPLEPEPKQLYPDGHPALKAEPASPEAPKATPDRRKPAANTGESQRVSPKDSLDPETGAIRPFGVN
jgi:hypothetical protein